MLLTADWVLPMSRPPIRNGAVLVRHGRIAAVGTLAELGGGGAGAAPVPFEGCVLMPGLVNAHTHISLSALEGLLEPAAFDRWLPKIVVAMNAWGAGDYAASAAVGAEKCLEAGVTVVGDITYGAESVAAAGDTGLGGVFYWEVLGIRASRLTATLEEMEFPSAIEQCSNARVTCGLSPHSAYTSGPSLLKAVHQAARDMRVPVAIHVAESDAETQLLREGTGPLASTAQRLADGFRAPGSSTVAYLDRLDALAGATAVHLGHALPTDIPRLAATVRGVVTCPRSNRYLSNRLPRVGRMLASGIPVGIGTDSSASNDDLDLFEEVRALRASDPEIPSRRLIEMVTSMGAVALGLESRYGMLEAGIQADLVAFRVGPTDTPERALVSSAGRSTVEAVISAGEWRIMHGRLVRPLQPGILAAADQATERARRALGAAGSSAG